jgi:putative tricarboxylic transport membrane protein
LGFPLAPVILGFILGPIAETNLRRGLMLFQGNFIPFLTKPIAGTFLTVAFISVVYSLIKESRREKSGKK